MSASFRCAFGLLGTQRARLIPVARQHTRRLVSFKETLVPDWILPINHTSTLERIASNKGKVAVVTGGARGIGAQIALGLAESGARIAVFDIAENPTRDEYQAIVRACPDTRYYRTDVTSPESVAESFRSMQDDLGPVDICVAAAGILKETPFIQVKSDELAAQINVNQIGVFHTVQQASKDMIKAGRPGAILVICSIASHRALSGQSASVYVMTKWALRGLVRQTATELGQHGIRINSLSPGYVQTALALPFITPERLAVWNKAIPLGRMERPDELKAPAVFLCSDAASYITGIDLLADGGAMS